MNVSVRGAELYYSIRGQGPACLVLSTIGTKPYERMTPPPLTDRLRLVYVDLRGSGRSTGEAADLTFDLLADDLEAVRADLGADRVAVLGHSINGVLAIEYGRRRPGSVSHVIAAGTPPFGDVSRVAVEAAAFFEEDASEERKSLLRENLAALPPGATAGETMYAQSPTRFFDPRVDARPLFAEAEFRPALMTHVLGTMMPGWSVLGGEPGPPILLAHGRYDYTVPWVLWKGVVEKVPEATLEVFERSGHQPFFEEPERFARAVAAWMSRAA